MQAYEQIELDTIFFDANDVIISSDRPPIELPIVPKT